MVMVMKGVIEMRTDGDDDCHGDGNDDDIDIVGQYCNFIQPLTLNFGCFSKFYSLEDFQKLNSNPNGIFCVTPCNINDENTSRVI